VVIETYNGLRDAVNSLRTLLQTNDTDESAYRNIIGELNGLNVQIMRGVNEFNAAAAEFNAVLSKFPAVLLDTIGIVDPIWIVKPVNIY
jgi:hypothetical protein